MALIDDFRKQTRETILDHMDGLGVNHAVYSTHLKGYEPDLLEKNIFLYIHAKSMVVVCFDLCGSRDEIADEQDPYDLNIPEYYSYNESRTSPVWQLSEAMKEMEYRTIKIFPPIDIQGVLLSESNILNAKDMKDKWSAMKITVIDGLKGLRHREIATNKSYSKEANTILRAILDEEAYIRNFELKAPFFPKSPAEDQVKIEDLSFPDGNIYQNDKISVKVEVLRPIANPREELDKLVGCADIKRKLWDLEQI